MTWRFEPIRHGLASKGVETSFGKSKMSKLHDREKYQVPPKDLYPIDWFKLEEADAPEMKKTIKLFWWCSLTDNWEWFNFDKAFTSMKMCIDDWLEYNIRYYNVFVPGKGEKPVMKGMPISCEEALELIKEDKYEQLKKEGKFEMRSEYAGVWREIVVDMLDLAKQMKNRENFTHGEKISLFDRAIHQEHMRSRHSEYKDSWFGLNLDELREKFKCENYE